MKIFNFLLIALWFAIVTVSVIHHEIFLDETLHLYFLINSNLDTFFRVMAENGQSHLFYLMIYPFRKFEYSYILLQIISAFAVFISIILIFLKLKLSLLLKFLIAFSAGMIYYLPVIARPYSLIPLFIFICAIYYKERKIHPFKYAFSLILLTQSSPIIWGFCLICSITFLIEKTIDFIKTGFDKKSEFILFLSLFVVYTSLIIFTYKNISINNGWGIYIFSIKYNISNFLEGLNRILIYGQWEEYKVYFLILITSYFAMLFTLNKKIFVIIFLSLISYCYFLTQIWTGIVYQKFFITILIIVFGYLIIEKKDNISYKLFNIVVHIICISVFFNPLFFSYFKDDIENHYTNTKETVYYLKNNKVKAEEVLFIVDYPQHILAYNQVFDMKKSIVTNFSGYFEEIENEITDNKNLKYIVMNNIHANKLIPRILTHTWITKLNIELKEYDKKAKISEYMNYTDELYRIYSVNSN